MPGDRNTAKRLRSDQASPDLAPSVQLEVTLSTRRFRLTRSPQWQRPKKRGNGMTTQQASVVVQESVNGSWTTHTTRLDEAGDLIAARLGMNLNQFCQVALLPQGRFQAFLRARSEDRQQLLQQLFRTQRFADIESWLADNRRRLRRSSTAAESAAMGLATRLSEASGETRPSTPSQDAGFVSEVRNWSARVVQDSRLTRERQAAALTELADRASAAHATHEDAVERFRLCEVYAKAQEEHQRLIETTEQHQRNRAILALGARAESLSPLIQLLEQVHRTHEAASDELRRLAEDAGIEVVDLATSDPHLTALLARCRDDLATLNALSPQADELRRLTDNRRDWENQIEEHAGAARRAEDEYATATDEVLLLRDALGHANAAATRLLELRSRAESLAHQIAAHDRAVDLAVEMESATRDLIEQRDATLALKEVWLGIREARLNGMAAEIASRLVVGGCCPVCGSDQHPHIAQATAHAPDAGSRTIGSGRFG